jgi:DUF1365 family protein
MSAAPSGGVGMTLPAQASIGFGQVRHKRLRPKVHAFAYRTFFLMLPLRRLTEITPALPVNRWGAISFDERDHGDGRDAQAGGALGWVTELLRGEGIQDADGEIWLHAYPRMWGYAFKPVSFWYCHRKDASLRAIVVEVNNTFGERHCYVLENPVFGAPLTARKCFHVSPFLDVTGDYAFRFMLTRREGRTHTVVRIDHRDGQGTLLQTSVSGVLEPITRASLRHALWAYPAMTWMLIARIHWHALQLWAKGIKFHRKPEPAPSFVTRTSIDP